MADDHLDDLSLLDTFFMEIFLINPPLTQPFTHVPHMSLQVVTCS